MQNVETIQQFICAEYFVAIKNATFFALTPPVNAPFCERPSKARSLSPIHHTRISTGRSLVKIKLSNQLGTSLIHSGK